MLNDLDEAKGSGPDDVSPLFLKTFASSLSTPLAHLFESSLSSGCFPRAWKLSHLVPIHKAGSRDDVSNYRGVSILSTIPKGFESMINKELKRHVKNLIIPQQHGFYEGRSCVTNLAQFTTEVAEVMEEGDQVDVVYTRVGRHFATLK